MNIVRTVFWVLLTVAVCLFVFMNWSEPQDVRIWPQGNGQYFLFEWPVGFIAIAFFLLGLVPTWLYYRGIKWNLKRRIRALESAARATAAAPAEPVVREPVIDRPSSEDGRTLAPEDRPHS
ncbi:LapA family protein [Qipengyuania sp. JC766]|uniref:LapA family protein n=1 Tax=Qipengyuania sp. JC766 TaxID=3232139 RepID=UPI0034597513